VKRREGQVRGRVVDVTEILLSLTTVKDVMVSMNAEWWDWTGEVTVVRVKGRISKWVSKSRGREQLSIEWELGIGSREKVIKNSIRQGKFV
jgi:hypothetical protein